MPQILQVEIIDASGVKATKTINVLRSWQDGGGAHLFLFGNGSYGYKNGEPVRSVDEFNVITSSVQHRAALAWWKRAGEELSLRYYEAKTGREEAMLGDFQTPVESDNSMLDAVLYSRFPQGKPEAKPEGPFSWMDLFPKRPDWWGQALSIAFGDFVYQRAEASEQGTPAMEGGGKAEGGRLKAEGGKKK
jgi:hypothetical protein